MSSHTDIDTLIASLHPHVAQSFCGNVLRAGRSLQPSPDSTTFHNVVDSFAILFGHHPGCDAAAVTIQTPPESKTTSVIVCPSPIIPYDFKDSVKRWVDEFIAIHKESTEGAGQGSDVEASPSMKAFILNTYRLCYHAMRERVMGHDFRIWNWVSRDPKERTPPLLVDEPLASKLRQVADLALSFAASISSRETLDGDEDSLRLHELSLALYDALNDDDMTEFIEQYIYPQGVIHILVHLCLPHALRTLLLDPSELPLPMLPDQWSTKVLDPAREARQFSTTVTTARFQGCFGNVPNVNWEEATEAYRKVVLGTEDYGKGLEWDAEKSLLSTPGVVTAHPETTLIQFLLENSGVAPGEEYIACSRIPCYASVRYVDAVNRTGKRTFTMTTTNPDWCRLDVAEPWILPQATTRAVISMLRELMLRDLGLLLFEWRHDPFPEEEDYDYVYNAEDREDEEDSEEGDGGEGDDDKNDDK